jgi:hypothetical protein
MAMNYQGIACRKPQSLAHLLAASKAAVFLRQRLDDLALKLTHDLRIRLHSVVDFADLRRNAGSLNQKQDRHMSVRASTPKNLQVLDSTPVLRTEGTVVRTRE